MSEITLSTIEKALLSREQDKLNEAMLVHLSAIKELIADACGYSKVSNIPVNKNFNDELTIWFNELKIHSTQYYGGDKLTIPNIKIPEFIERKMLEKATLNLLSDVQNIRDLMEHTA